MPDGHEFLGVDLVISGLVGDLSGLEWLGPAVYGLI
jgi:hypothetical protein